MILNTIFNLFHATFVGHARDANTDTVSTASNILKLIDFCLECDSIYNYNGRALSSNVKHYRFEGRRIELAHDPTVAFSMCFQLIALILTST